MKKILAVILLLFVANSSFSQELTFEASGQTNVAIGEQFLIRFTINRQGTNFIGPAFSGINILSGPNLSTNTSYSNINGKMSQSTSITFTYYLRAVTEGNFTVAPAKVTVDGKEYQTKELSITVTKEPVRTNTNSGSEATQAQTELNENDLFIKASVNKRNPYQGEQVILTYKIYTKVPIAQIGINKQSNFQGFWMKDLLNPQDVLKQDNEVIGGEQYVTAEFRKFALFPQKSGTLTIDAMELQCVAQIRQANRRSSNSFLDSFFDDPFFGGTRNIQKVLKSNPISINVKPLPESNKPVNFSGAVGEFTFVGVIDKNELKTNDAVNLKFTLSGSGNIELIDQLNINFPPDIEVFEPEISNSINSNSISGISGTRKFDYLLIPRNPGKFIINPVTFTYFSPRNNSYQSITSPAFELEVEKGDNYQAGINYSGASQEDIQYIGTDIHHIKIGSFELYEINYYLFNTLKFILWFVIPLILFIVLIIFWKQRSKKLSNQSLMRHKRATKVARKNLKQAQQYLGTQNITEFYNEISQALWGYLSDKFNIPHAELSKESVNEKLTDREVNEKSINQFIETLNNCDFARFAPGNPESTMEIIYNEALEIISKIERELK